MKDQNFSCSITANIPAGEAMKKIGNVPDWWGVAFSGNAQKQSDRFVIKMGGDSFFDLTVAELIPDKKVIWLVTNCNMPWYEDKKEWAGTKLVFDLTEENGATTLVFTHEGLTPQVACYNDCKTGWTHWIRTSLFSYFNTGEGRKKSKVNKSYTTSIEVPYAVSVVFRRVNDVAKWWPEAFEGNSIRLNDEFVLRTGDVHYSKQQIVEFIPNEKVVWLVTDSLRTTDNYEWTGAKMIFQLTPRGNDTLISYTYDGPVFENEYDRLVQVCDAVIKENLYSFIIENNDN